MWRNTWRKERKEKVVSRQEEKNDAVRQAAVSVLSHKSCRSEVERKQELLARI